jgi:hypothetical protein
VAQQLIVNTPTNSGLGDPNNIAWGKANANFTELYAGTPFAGQFAIYGVDSGAVNAYVFTHAGPTPATLTAGVLLRFTAANPNTGASTLNADGTGAVAVLGQNGVACTGGEIGATPTWVQYTGAAWIIVGTGAPPDKVRTAAETAGAVVPASYTRWPNDTFVADIRRYGGQAGLGNNNTAAFNSALAALGANGGVIFFPIGDWRGDFRVNQNNVTILGQGGVGETNTTCLRPWTTASYAVVNAGAFVIGTLYQIITLGTTDFTAIGAGSNTVGLWFRCVVGSGSGSGTARPCTSATLLFGDGSTTFRKCGIRDLVIAGDDGSGNISDIALGLHGQSNFSALRFELFQGQHSLHLEPRGGNPITGCMFSHHQIRNDNTPNAISAINIGTPTAPVITVSTVSAANPFAVNMLITYNGVGGMTQINELVGRVTAIGGASGAWTATTDTNCTGFSAFTAGGNTNNANMRSIWGRRNDSSVAGNYFTNVHITHGHVNGPPGSCSTVGRGSYLLELDGTNSPGMTLGVAESYFDIKGCTTPAGTNACGGVLLRTSNESLAIWNVNFDPSATGVVVLESNSATQDLSQLVTGLLIADNQYYKSTASSILIAVGSQTTFNKPLMRDPYISLSAGLTLGNALDPYGNKAADAGAPLPVINEDGPLGPITLSNADWSVKTISKGLRVAEGTNGRQGLSASMVAGAVTVTTTAVTANSRILVARQPGGTNPGAHYVSAVTPGTSFVITSTNVLDTGKSAYLVLEPA